MTTGIILTPIVDFYLVVIYTVFLCDYNHRGNFQPLLPKRYKDTFDTDFYVLAGCHP